MVCNKKQQIFCKKNKFLIYSHSEKLKNTFHDQTLGIDILSGISPGIILLSLGLDLLFEV